MGRHVAYKYAKRSDGAIAHDGKRLGRIIYIQTNAFNNSVLATDTNGNVVWKETYKPYGEQVNKQSASANNKLWFHGKSFDQSTGLSYFGARYYDPVLGRFMGVDPVDFREDNIHSFNRYAYGNNNPYRYRDPDGRSPDEIKFGRAGGGKPNIFRQSIEVEASGSIDRITDFQASGANQREIIRTFQAGSTVAKDISPTQHSVQQKINRLVKSADEIDALKNPLKVNEVKVDSLGRPSQRYIGGKAEVAINPETGKIVSVNPTSSAKAERLTRQQGGGE